MLAVLLGTWEALLRAVGKLKTASPALPREIKRSTMVIPNSSGFSKASSNLTHPTPRTGH